MITRIHVAGDYQTERYQVGNDGVVSIESFEINGQLAPYPRIRITFDDGRIIETDEAGMTVYSDGKEQESDGN